MGYTATAEGALWIKNEEELIKTLKRKYSDTNIFCMDDLGDILRELDWFNLIPANDHYVVTFAENWNDEWMQEIANVAAPFVQEGTIYCYGDDHAAWRFSFKDGVFDYDDGEIIFSLADICDEAFTIEATKRGYVKKEDA